MKISNHHIHISRREELHIGKQNEHQYKKKGIEGKRLENKSY